MSSSLEQLKATGTVVVCDSGKFHPIHPDIACIEHSTDLRAI